MSYHLLLVTHGRINSSAQTYHEEQQQEVKEAQKKMAEAQKELEKMRNELEAERARPGPVKSKVFIVTYLCFSTVKPILAEPKSRDCRI